MYNFDFVYRIFCSEEIFDFFQAVYCLASIVLQSCFERPPVLQGYFLKTVFTGKAVQQGEDN